jgi:hypothetical protein
MTCKDMHGSCYAINIVLCEQFFQMTSQVPWYMKLGRYHIMSNVKLTCGIACTLQERSLDLEQMGASNAELAQCRKALEEACAREEAAECSAQEPSVKVDGGCPHALEDASDILR